MAKRTGTRRTLSRRARAWARSRMGRIMRTKEGDNKGRETSSQMSQMRKIIG